jgi:hypothetical protein
MSRSIRSIPLGQRELKKCTETEMLVRRRRLGISENHLVRIIDSCGKRLGERDFAMEARAWPRCHWAEPSAIHVGIEMPHGPIVETLLERGFNVYAINPKQLDRFRDRFSPAGAKDDGRDAEVLADALRTDMRTFRKLALADPLGSNCVNGCA